MPCGGTKTSSRSITPTNKTVCFTTRWNTSDGPDLAQLLAEYASAGELMPHGDVLRIGHAVARALDYAHAQGIIHRDIKPSNVMVASDGRVVLTDFGLALDVAQGTVGEVFGTPHYIAPEQARRSSDAVPQSDIYAWGVVLYEMLTGIVPFDDPSPTSLALQHLTMAPPPPRQINPALNEETEAVLLKALSKSPADRYPTAGALMDALDQALHAPRIGPRRWHCPRPRRSAGAAPLPVPDERRGPGGTVCHRHVHPRRVSRTDGASYAARQAVPGAAARRIGTRIGTRPAFPAWVDRAGGAGGDRAGRRRVGGAARGQRWHIEKYPGG